MQKIKKATLLGVAFFVPIVGLSAESTPVQKVISQAQNLMLKDDRSRALNLLTKTYESTTSKKEKDKVLEVAEKMARIFRTEKAQKLFELAESLSSSNPSLARIRYKEALTVESENIEILISLAKLEAQQSDCNSAFSRLEAAEALLPISERVRLFRWQAMSCAGQFDEARAEFSKQELSTSLSKEPAMQVLQARADAASGHAEKAVDSLKQISKEHEEYPEVWYWRWKLDPAQGKINPQWADKYRTLCKSLTPRVRRIFQEKSFLCLHVGEVNEYFDSIKTDGDLDE